MKKALGLAVMALALVALEAQAGPAKAYNIRMRRTDMPDTTDVQSILSSIISGGETDEEKAKAIWRVVFQYSHQDNPPNEKIDGCTHDVVKLFNVYGYRMCCCASSCVETLADAAGLTDAAHTPRTRQLTGHNVPEIWYGSAWHMLDSSLITYFNKDAGAGIASVDELAADIAGLINLAHCPFANPVGEWFPANTHSLNDSRTEYSSVNPNECADGYSNGWSVGHRNLLTLREGETLVRDCSVPAAHHVDEDTEGPPGCIDNFAGTGLEFQYMNDVIPDQPGTYYYVHPGYHGGIVGNGTLTYEPNFSHAGYRGGMEEESNIACTADDAQSPGLHLAATGTGYVIFKMQSPYVFLDGDINATFKRAAAGDSVKVYLSTNNMVDWTEIYSAAVGTANVEVDFRNSVIRRYCYYLKFEFISATSVTAVGMDSLTITSLIQHAQRAMPFLVQGNNQFTVGAGSATSTMSVQPRLTEDGGFTENESLVTIPHTLTNMYVDWYGIWSTGATPSHAVFPVSVPGDIVAVRFGGTLRLREANDDMDLEISFTAPDSGYSVVKSLSGPDPKLPCYVEYTSIPAGARDVWVRFTKTSLSSTVGISGHLRIDVDYQEAGAMVKPFKIKHEWTENSTPMSHTETVTSVPHNYSINCANEPTMTALTVWVEQVIDTTPPEVDVTACDLTGTVNDAGSMPTVVTVGGVDVPVSGNDWSRSDVPVSSGVPIVISATDASSNTATVNVTVTF